jgi:hypothetical protein
LIIFNFYITLSSLICSKSIFAMGTFWLLFAYINFKLWRVLRVLITIQDYASFDFILITFFFFQVCFWLAIKILSEYVNSSKIIVLVKYSSLVGLLCSFCHFFCVTSWTYEHVIFLKFSTIFFWIVDRKTSCTVVNRKGTQKGYNEFDMKTCKNDTFAC